MSQFSPQTLIAILQLILTTFQFIYTLFSSYCRRRDQNRARDPDEEDSWVPFQHAYPTHTTIDINTHFNPMPLPRLPVSGDGLLSSTYLSLDMHQGGSRLQQVRQAPTQHSDDQQLPTLLNRPHEQSQITGNVSS
ncbi:hypothetical protein F5B22DRAFT_440454 [Xylaria bambusicola]|uniref:uncharacterized protein n=1 Tax=Xylaria bambusicola TaxID=326684 RepID=UPI00200767C4|nr:uncharacterized protein F5B22DRAFT_440454 [Xylaria bambusicola]KAI0506694.1 hypothetical protein F5B22DRAFT_440454 [Xylaria bambusicola]